jgi:RNA methyltransferase, TrmH family
MRDGMPNKLTSSQNPKIKTVLHLRDKKERDNTGLFLIEGYRELKRAIDAGVRFESLFICPELFLGSNETALIASCDVKVFELSESLFHKVSYRDRPDGLMGIAYQMKRSLADLEPQRAGSIYVVAEAIEKPGNLGTILRSSDAVGASGVIVCDRCTDIYNPNVVRASVGTLFTRPVVEAPGDEVLKWLKQHHIQIVAATPSASIHFTEAPLSGSVAIVVGTEQLGLTQKWLDAADICVKIPMKGVADSLNVAMATTLLLYEALRQRG